MHISQGLYKKSRFSLSTIEDYAKKKELHSIKSYRKIFKRRIVCAMVKIKKKTDLYLKALSVSIFRI